MPGEDSKDNPRSPYAELHSKSSLPHIAELPGGLVATELDAPEFAPKLPGFAFDDDVEKQPPIAEDENQKESRKSTEKR